MSQVCEVPLSDLMSQRKPGSNPANHPDERFTLYSVPAFDRAAPEELPGREIGSSKQVIAAGDVLLSKIVPHIRRVWIVTPSNGSSLIGSNEWIAFRSDRVVPEYLRHYLISDDFHAQFMQTVAGVGGSLMRARPALVARIRVPLPTLDEQRRIARVLDAADGLRAKRREVLARLRTLSQAVVRREFDIRAEQRWPVVKLGDELAFLTSGSRGWARYYADAGAPFLRIQNVRHDELVLEDVAFVNPPTTAEANRTTVNAGDVLLSITADLGRTAVVPEDLGPAHINQHLAVLRPSTLNPRYLSSGLASALGRRQLQRRNRQGVKAGLNFDDIRSVALPNPPRDVQDAFVCSLAAIDAARARNRSHLAHLDALFASLQFRAFSGGL